MRICFLSVFVLLMMSSCNNNGKSGQTFCDTTCNNDTIKFEGNSAFEQKLKIGMKNCLPDTVSWTHRKALNERKIQLTEFLNKNLKINRKAVDAAFQDTSFVWLSFNDCVTGRGYLLKLPYSQGQTQKISGALNSFDHKFSVDPDLRAYTDRGNIYVVNVTNGKEAQMTFREEYKDIDFDDIHKVVDTINVTKQRIFVRLLKNGKEVPFEKNIEL